MSCYLKLQNSDIIQQIFTKAAEASIYRLHEYKVAIRIQAWWRGHLVRKAIRNLHKKATIIQSAFRRQKGKELFGSIVDKAVESMRHKFYHQMATRIQTRWRGFHTRKFIHNYYARKKYLQAIEEENCQMRKSLNEYEKTEREREALERELRKEKEIIQQARKVHYMKSTFRTAGVFNSPTQPNREFEYLLSKVRPLSREDRERKRKIKETLKLPPIVGKAEKIQGPFRSREEVRRQRYRPFSPTLRVSTEYGSKERYEQREREIEQTKRIQTKEMSFPVRRTISKMYEPLLHTKSKFGNIEYGTKFFREEAKEKKFCSVVEAIPVFDRFCKTYGKGNIC